MPLLLRIHLLALLARLTPSVITGTSKLQVRTASLLLVLLLLLLAIFASTMLLALQLSQRRLMLTALRLLAST
jgi:hypothetical protein